MNYYDMHSHILPEMDDGSESVELSLKIIDKLQSQGVNNICFTPHYYSNEESIDDFTKRRQNSLGKLLPVIPSEVNYTVGAEVYVTSFLFNNKDLSQLCYGNSKYILCEFSFGSHFGESTMQSFYKLQGNYGLKPVLTHIERYGNLMDNERLIQQLVHDGIIIQSNVGAYDSLFKRRKLIKYIRRGYIKILGTDCHSLSRGNPDRYMSTVELIKNRCSEKCVKDIMSTSAKIFESAR